MTTTQPRIFNPGVFGSQSQKEVEIKNNDQTKDYPLTGNITRDQVRKMFYECFSTDPKHVENEKLSISEIIEALENQILTEHSDIKSKQYRDKSRSIQLKIKGQRFDQVRKDLRTGQITPEQLCSDSGVQTLQNNPIPQQQPQPRMVTPNTARPMYRGRPPMGGPMMRPPIIRPQTNSIPKQQEQAQQEQQMHEDEIEIEVQQTKAKEIEEEEQRIKQEMERRKREEADKQLQLQQQLQLEQAQKSEQAQKEQVKAVDQQRPPPMQMQQRAPMQNPMVRPMMGPGPRPRAPQTLVPRPVQQQPQQQQEIEREAVMREEIKTPIKVPHIEQTSHQQIQEQPPQSQVNEQQSQSKEMEIIEKRNQPEVDESELERQRALEQFTKALEEGVPSSTQKQKKGKKKGTKKKKLNKKKDEQNIDDSNSMVILDKTGVNEDELQDTQQDIQQDILQNQFENQQTVQEGAQNNQIEEEKEIEIEQKFDDQTILVQETQQSQQSSRRNSMEENKEVKILTNYNAFEEKQTSPKIVVPLNLPIVEQIKETIQTQRQPSPLRQLGDVDQIKRLQDQLQQFKEQNVELRTKLNQVEQDHVIQVKKVAILTEENKKLRGELRSVQVHIRESQEDISGQIQQNQIRKLESEVKQKNTEIQQLKTTIQQARDERESQRSQIKQITEEGKQWRDRFDKQYFQRASTQNQNVNQASQEQYQNDLQQIRNQYEQQIRDKNAELAKRTKDWQRVERQNVTLSQTNQQLNESIQTLQIQVLSTVAGSGSNQRDSEQILQQHYNQFSSNQQQPIIQQRRYEDEGTGGYTDQVQQDEGGEQQIDAGQNLFEAEQNEQVEEVEDEVEGEQVDYENEDDEGEDYAEDDYGEEGEEGQAQHEGEEEEKKMSNASQMHQLTQQQYGYQQPKPQTRRRGNKQQFMQTKNNELRGKGQGKRIRGRQGKSKQNAQVEQQEQMQQQLVPQINRQAADQYFQSFGDSSLFHKQNEQSTALSGNQQQIRDGAVGPSVFRGSGLASVESMMNAESGSTAFIDKYHRGGAMPRINNQGQFPYHIGQHMNNEQVMASNNEDQDIIGAAVRPQQNIRGRQQISSVEEIKQATNNQQYYVGGSGEQEEEQQQQQFFNDMGNNQSSSGNYYAFMNQGETQMNNNRRETPRRNVIQQLNSIQHPHEQIMPPRQNQYAPHRSSNQDSKKTSGANTPNKEGADTPTMKTQQQYRGGTSYVHNLTSNNLFFSNQEENDGGQGSYQQQQHYKDLDVIPRNMFE